MLPRAVGSQWIRRPRWPDVPFTAVVEARAAAMAIFGMLSRLARLAR